MTTQELIVAGCLLVVLISMALLLLSGRGGWLIAGFNTLPRKERERYDKRALCRFMGRFLLVAAGALVLVFASDFWPGYGLFGIGMTLLLGAVLFVLIWTNTGNRFLQKP